MRFEPVRTLVGAPARLACPLFAGTLTWCALCEILLATKALARAVLAATRTTGLAPTFRTTLWAGAAILARAALRAITAVTALRPILDALKPRLALGRALLFALGLGQAPVLGPGQQPVAQLIAEHLAANLDHVAGVHVIESERPIAHADQPVHGQADLGHRATDFTVLALADAHRQPRIRALLAVERNLHWLELLAVDGDAPAQRIEGRLGRAPVHAHAVFAQPAGLGQFQPPLQPAIVGQQQKTFGIEVKTPHVKNARHLCGHLVENRAPTLLVLLGRHQPQRLVIKPHPGFLRCVDRLAVDHHLVLAGNIERGALDQLAVDAHATGEDHLLGIAARGNARAGNDLGDTFGGLRRIGGSVGHLCRPSKGMGAGDTPAQGASLHLSKPHGKRLARRGVRGDERT